MISGTWVGGGSENALRPRRRRIGTMLGVVASPLLLLATAAGCGEDDLLGSATAVPTEVAVDPADFLGDVPCRALVGAAQSYVLTLDTFGVEGEDDDSATPIRVGSSGPVSCASEVGFRDVIVDGARYVASVDVFEAAPDTLTPEGGFGSGARTMIDRSGARVLPRWTTTCGGGVASAVEAVADARVAVRPCAPLTDREEETPPPTRLVVPPEQVLGPEPCAVASRFALIPIAGDLPLRTAIACNSRTPEYDVVADTAYRLYAEAEREDGTPVGAVCEARAIAGLTVVATCGPLSDRGAVQVDLASLDVSRASARCPDGARYDVVDAQGNPLNAVAVPCGATTSITSVVPGEQVYRARVFEADGAPTGDIAECTATVLPGRSVDATCGYL